MGRSLTVIQARQKAFDLVSVLSQEILSLNRLIKQMPDHAAKAYQVSYNKPAPKELCGEDAKQHIAKAFMAITYDDDQEPNESRFYIGAVGATPKLLRQAKRVNNAKTEFTNFLSDCKSDPEFGYRAGQNQTLTSILFGETQFARLHRLQCERHLIILSSVPQRICFSMTDQVRHYPIDKHRALELARSGAREQNRMLPESHVSQLMGLPDDEVLIRRRVFGRRPMANVWHEGERRSMKKSTSIPLLFPLGEEPTVIEMTACATNLAGSRRRPTKLRKDPLIEYPQIFQYRPEYARHAEKH
ncbi:DNA replication terminus site-binding protein [Idiomarina abyssalis]|uniref:DNA replication terminus site-binding protein n=1 Tax=Idiomarina abyssalis TaxID=86102 RepID=A0A8I1KIB4_9GAMM|nr:DNA replication terminus site-binding protein [Idiomarina abyssalis]MBJ7265601.1 hypothetical protein [Idiomarina abyssalis]MBJ7316725.1 hypothetical protein [Idiomarina abyssalis]